MHFTIQQKILEVLGAKSNGTENPGYKGLKILNTLKLKTKTWEFPLGFNQYYSTQRLSVYN